MKVIIQTKEKDIFGMYHLSVLIDSKEYTFHLASEYAVRQAKNSIRKRKPGRAINILKQFNYKSEEGSI